MDEHTLEQWSGTAAAYSEHRRGKRVMFLEEGMASTGVILWIAAACLLESGILLPMRYIIEADQRKCFPCIILPGNVIACARSVPEANGVKFLLSRVWAAAYHG